MSDKQIPLTVLHTLLGKWKLREEKLYEKHKLLKSKYTAGEFDGTHTCSLDLIELITKETK